MTFKEFKQEVGNKKEWYVCEYAHYNNPNNYGGANKYWVTRCPELGIYKDKIYKKPKTLQDAHDFRNILNKLTRT